MKLVQEQYKRRNKNGWFHAILLLVLLPLSFQGCATNFRGDYRFGRLVPSEERQLAEKSISGTHRQSDREDMSSGQPSGESRSSQSNRTGGPLSKWEPVDNHGNRSERWAERPSDSPVTSETKPLSDKTFGDLFGGPLVGFVAGNLLLRWSHPLIWLGAMALAVIIESEAMEYVRQVFLSP